MANDIIDINVYETVETVSITVNPNLTTVNINQVTGGGGGGSQDLQSVTDIGATTTNTITANSITTTIDSTINGVRVGRGNIAGNVSGNTAIGNQALQSVINTTGTQGYNNTAVGSEALKSLTTGSNNTAVGYYAGGKATSSGSSNILVGFQAGRDVSTGTNNLLIENLDIPPLGTIAIGSQIWATKNLDVTTYTDGTPIPLVQKQFWAGLTTGAYCHIDDNPANDLIYGKLYNGYAVLGIHDNDPNTPNKTLAPAGYHIPTDAEWTTLTDYLGGASVSGGKMKSTGTSLWQSPNTGATNESGFTALPAGFLQGFNGEFNNKSITAYFWSSSEFNANNLLFRYLGYDYAATLIGNISKINGFSVRAIKDANPSITSGSYNIILNPKEKSGVTTGSNNTIIGCFDNTLSAGLTSNVIIGNGAGAIRFQSTDTGLTTVPAQTNTLINGDATGKAVVTKEYLTNSQTVFVPYTGATTDVNLGLNDITAAKLIKDGGFDYQFLKADGSVDNNIYLTSADLPSTLDLYATTTASDISGYTVLVRNIADTRYNTTAVDVSTGVITSIGQLVGSLVTDANIISGNPGVFDFKTIGNISRTNGTGQAEFFFRIYKRNLAGTETLIAQSDYTLPVTNGGYVEFSATALWNDGIFLDTDRVVLKYYANRLTSPVGSDPTYQFQFGGTSPVRSSAAIPTSVMPNIYLRDLADVENVDALNNEILYWNDPASLWEHSLAENLVPLATATQKGLVSTTTQTIAGDKTFTGTIGASNLSNTNTGDNATNTQYSGLAASKQDTLQNTVNIKSINGNSILGSGDLTISGTGISSLNGLTGATQTFSVFPNFTGSPSFVSTGTNHQLKLPNAGPGTDYGLITNGSQSIGGTKQFQSNPEIPVPAGNSGSCIVLGTTGGGGATGTLQIGSTTLYPTALEMQYVKGITSSVQTQLDNKASIIDVAEQTYSLSPTFTITAPTTIVANTYKWSRVGSSVTVRVNLSYTTAGSFTTVVIPLPTDMPTPLSPTGFTAASDILYYGTGTFTTTTSATTNVGRVTFLRRNAANNGYEFVIIHSSAVAARVVALTLQYFT